MQKTKQILPAVAAAIFNKKGEVLLQRRRDVNQWCIISGHVEFGETVEEAILREIKEETERDAKLVRFIGVYSSPESQTYVYHDKDVQYVTSYFQAEFVDDIPFGFSNDETIELKFFDIDNIPANLALINEKWLEDARSDTKVFVR